MASCSSPAHIIRLHIMSLLHHCGCCVHRACARPTQCPECFFGWSELRSVAEPDARVGFGCLRRSRTPACRAAASHSALFWADWLSRPQGCFLLDCALPGAGVCNACKFFFALQGLVVGQATKRSMAANEHFLGELGSCVCIKKRPHLASRGICIHVVGEGWEHAAAF